ncbi:type II CAAX prenyl endopeptidase Rce1 family protein [Leifsonia sp. NPDC058194]|uniref:CPBP family glutamic-type intramembrane protease n=1 Tax=Leifsonia sp. NPDC058194 TaxID=3346374 RepID=UPI0036D86363
MTAAQTEPAAPASASARRRVPYSPDPRVRWGLPAALSAVVAVAVVWIALVAIVKAASLDADAASLIVWVVTYGAVIVAAVFITKNRGSGSLRVDYGLAFRWYDVFIGLGTGVGLIVVTAPISAIIEALYGETSTSNDQAASSDGIWLVVNGFIAVAVVAPFCEELLLRGLVLRGIRNSMLRRSTDEPTRGARRTAAVVAVLGSAVLFAALHLHEGIGSPVTMTNLGVVTFCLGLVNGVYAARTGRLGPGIWTHVFFNLVTTTLMTVRAHS